MKRILYLEDDQIEVFRIKRICKELSSNFEVFFADSFKKAQVLLGEVEFDLIVTDHNLVDGAVTDYPGLFGEKSFVLVSGMESHQLNEIAKDIGAMKSFTKPVNASELLAFMESYLLIKGAGSTDKAGFTSGNNFDPSVLESVTGGDPSLQLELTKMFHDNLSIELDKVRGLLIDGERDKLQSIVHNLKPKLKIFGQEELSDVCRSIESQLMEGVELDAINEQLNQLESNGKEFLGLLNKYLTYN